MEQPEGRRKIAWWLDLLDRGQVVNLGWGLVAAGSSFSVSLISHTTTHQRTDSFAGSSEPSAREARDAGNVAASTQYSRLNRSTSPARDQLLLEPWSSRGFDRAGPPCGSSRAVDTQQPQAYGKGATELAVGDPHQLRQHFAGPAS